MKKSFFNLKLISLTILLLILITPISAVAQQTDLPPLPDTQGNTGQTTKIRIPYSGKILNVETSNNNTGASPADLGGGLVRDPSADLTAAQVKEMTGGDKDPAKVAADNKALIDALNKADRNNYVMTDPSTVTPLQNSTLSTNICQAGICNYTLLAPIGTFLGNENNGRVYQITQKSNSLCQLLNSWFRIGIALAGMLAVVMIVIGGFQYATTDSLFGKSEGRTKVNDALFGLALALGTWLILNTINPALTNCSLDAKPTTAINSTVAGGTVSTGGVVTGSLAGSTGGTGQSYGVKGPGSIVANTQAGLMFPNQEWNATLVQEIKDSGIMNLSPSDSAKYFPNGNPTAEQWASLFVSIANKETTGFNPKDNTVEHKLDGNSSFSSEGLFSLSVGDPEVKAVARNNGVTPQDVLGDPTLSIKSSVQIMKRTINDNGYIGGPKGYWGPTNRGE